MEREGDIEEGGRGGGTTPISTQDGLKHRQVVSTPVRTDHPY